MKKQNEVKNEQTSTKQKRTKREHLFFLYANGKGFICASMDGMPTIGGNEPLFYTDRRKANFAIEFFKQMKLAEDIALVAKVG